MKLSTTSKTLLRISRAGREGKFLSFSYTKEDGSKSDRTVRFGGDIAAKFARDGQPIKGESGRGNWVSQSKKTGTRGMILERNGKVFVRGTDLKDSKSKCFLLSGISLK